MSQLLPPLDPNNWSGFGITHDGGVGLCGRISDLTAEEIGGELHVAWSIELADGVDSSEVAVFVFVDGAHRSTVSGETSWTYRPPRATSIEKLDFLLGPNDSRWASHFDVLALVNRVHLSWTLNAAARKVLIKHCYGSGTPTTTVATLSTVRARQNGNNGSVSNSAMYCDGIWEDPDTLYTTIHVAITTAGDTDEAIYTWTWGTWAGTGIVRSYPDHLFNGIRVWFEANAPYAIGDEWDISVGLPTSWDSGNLSVGGPSTYGVNTVNSAGDITTGPTKAVDLYIPPAAPTLASSPTYADGSGEISITYTPPASCASGLSLYRIYQCYAHDGVRVVDYSPILSGACTVGVNFAVTVTTLEAGYNRVVATVVDAEGLESDFSEVWEITLDANLHDVGSEPNPPDSISGAMDSSGDIVLDVVADDTSTAIDIYHDALTGTIDYTTVVATITNPQDGMFQHLSATLTGLSDGIYMIGARARSHTIYETNTDVWCTVLRDNDAAPAVTGLQAAAIG